jgi:hypothetical protein
MEHRTHALHVRPALCFYPGGALWQRGWRLPAIAIDSRRSSPHQSTRASVRVWLQARLVTNLEHLNVVEETDAGSAVPMPELQHNIRLLVDMAEADIQRLDAKLRHQKDTTIILGREQKRLQVRGGVRADSLVSHCRGSSAAGCGRPQTCATEQPSQLRAIVAAGAVAELLLFFSRRICCACHFSEPLSFFSRRAVVLPTSLRRTRSLSILVGPSGKCGQRAAPAHNCIPKCPHKLCSQVSL